MPSKGWKASFLILSMTFICTLCIAWGFESQLPDLAKESTGTSSSAEGRAALEVDVNTLSARTGGVVNFSLDAGPTYFWRIYILFGSVSGTAPGLMLPSGKVLPINWDYFSDYILVNMNTPMFHNFIGMLDHDGIGSAQLNTVGAGFVSQGCIGKKLYFAYCTSCYWDFVSNPVEIEIVD